MVRSKIPSSCWSGDGTVCVRELTDTDHRKQSANVLAKFGALLKRLDEIMIRLYRLSDIQTSCGFGLCTYNYMYITQALFDAGQELFNNETTSKITPKYANTHAHTRKHAHIYVHAILRVIAKNLHT